LQIVEGALRFIRQQRKAKVASTNAVESMTRAFVQAIEQFVEQQGIAMVSFPKRTETAINNTRDFYIGKSLHNLAALRKIGFQANRRVLKVQTIMRFWPNKPYNNSNGRGWWRANYDKFLGSRSL
jgi:hypothetical protein